MCVSDVLEFRTATLRLNWLFFSPLFFSPKHCTQAGAFPLPWLLDEVWTAEA